MTTLTREKLFKQCATEYKTVQVEGFGKVGIRGVPEVQRSKRISSLFDVNGNLVASTQAERRVTTMIDQLMIDEKTPMFTEDDREELLQLDGVKLDPLIAVISEFNGDLEKKETAESGD